MSYVDLHLHLLPGIDDGPGTLDQSLRHAARIAADGVHAATVTPHVGHPAFAVDVTAIAERTRALQAALDAEGIGLRLHPGGEIHPDAAGELGRDDLELLAHGPAGSRWVLVEVPFGGVDQAFLRACAAIRRRGLALVIAHPERAAGFLETGRHLLERELVAGSVLQVNVCSLLGRHGPAAQAGARRLVAEGRAHVLASDGHGGTRGHTLADGVGAALAAGATEQDAWRMTVAHPRSLLRDGLPRPAAARSRAGRDRGVAAARAARAALG